MRRKEGGKQTLTRVLELRAQHLPAEKHGAFPVQKSLASRGHNLFTAVWYVGRRRDHRGDFRPPSKIPVRATQAHMKGNVSPWRAWRWRPCLPPAAQSSHRGSWKLVPCHGSCTSNQRVEARLVGRRDAASFRWLSCAPSCTCPTPGRGVPADRQLTRRRGKGSWRAGTNRTQRDK